MLTAEVLAARAAAILVSRRSHAAVYAQRGCEDLDRRYEALSKALRKARFPAADLDRPAAALYGDLLVRVREDSGFAGRLDAAIGGEYPSAFGRLVAFVVANWGRVPAAQRALAAHAEDWAAGVLADGPPEPAPEFAGEMLATARKLYLFVNIWALRRMARLLDPALLRATRDFPAIAFSAVQDEELDEIEILRGGPCRCDNGEHPAVCADQAHLTGLAFSGGGIRSATFNLGVLQFLGANGLLRGFDYLSTVSGGGYIGAWLHAWVHHAGEADRAQPGVEQVQKCLSPNVVSDPQDERVAPIRFLRRYSSYLTPEVGFFSADTWTMINIWVRNTSLNLLVLVLALAAVLLAPRWLADAAFWLDDRGVTDFWWVLLIPSAWLIGKNIGAIGDAGQFRVPWVRKESAILLLVVLPVLLAAWAGGTVVPRDIIEGSGDVRDIFFDASSKFAFIMAWLVLVASVAGGVDRFFVVETRRFKTLRAWLWVLSICAIASIASGILSYLWLRGVILSLDLTTPLKILTESVPGFLAIVGLTVFLYMGLMGRRFPDDRREWTARLGAWLSICSLGWIGLCGIAAFGPAMIQWTAERNWAGVQGLSLTWILTTASGLYSARSAARKNGAESSVLSRIVMAVAPTVFVFGLLLLLSVFLDRAAADKHGWTAFAISVACGVTALLLSRRIDINEFSLHQFYRNRLVRCYLGGARAGLRRPNPFTGFDPADDLRLTALAPSAGHSGPYPIVNTTLNIVHGDELAWQERKAEPFAFTPRFCGFDVGRGRATHARTAGQPRLSYGGYRPTADYAYPNPDDHSEFLTGSGITLGTAMAISGAAASPNMGAGTTSALAFLMTILDVRLGWWLGNPRRTDTWQRPGPKTGIFQLIAELTANTNDTGRYVYLSDGGHFENLAAYELIRRRCRLIVVCDSEEDHACAFAGLGNLIRKCRSDFGVDIEIDAGSIKPPEGKRRGAAHCAVGTIRYPAYGGGAGPEGVLLYIKSSLTGDEPADVQQYSLRVPLFPHESTADQWFDESKFESYRALGYHVAGKSFAELGQSEAATRPQPGLADAIRRVTERPPAAAASAAST